MSEGPNPDELVKRVNELEGENRRLKERISTHRESEEKYRFLTENATDVIFVQDMALNVTYVSPSVESLFGYSAEEAPELKMPDIMTPESYQRAISSFQRAIPLAEERKAQDIPLMEYEYIRKDGSTFWGELKVAFLYDSQNRPVGCQGILRNIDKRRQTERALRDSESKFRCLFDLSPQAISVTEFKTGRLIDVNNKFCEVTGYSKEEIVGRTVTESGLYSPNERKNLLSMLKKSGEIQGLETAFTFKGGPIGTALVFAKLIHPADQSFILSVLYDTSEKKRLEAQLMRAQKMEAIGKLAGGVAHDFNNLLMAVQGNVSIMLLNKQPNHPHFMMLKNIEKQVQSGVGLTRQLLGYARKGKYEALPVDMNKLLEDTMGSFSRTRKEIRIHQSLSKNLFAIDRGQMEQILLNLFINAADAMPDGGELFIETANVTHHEMHRSVYDPKPGDYILLRVTDTGMGMDKETMARIFDPFFTTKEMGRGTGLGLASVFGIVKGHGGYIDVDSEKAKGSAFSLYFPASKTRIRRPSPTQKPPVEGNGTILVVDDEERVLHITAKLLGHLGYCVLEAKCGREAVELYQKNLGGIDIVILDMIMPELSGAQTFEILKGLDPHVKVLLCSGYSINGQATDILGLGCDGFIQKPYTTNDLSLKLDEILAKPKNND